VGKEGERLEMALVWLQEADDEEMGADDEEMGAAEQGSLVCSWKRGEDRPHRGKIGTVAKQEEK
jgi:hypothetical protein